MKNIYITGNSDSNENEGYSKLITNGLGRYHTSTFDSEIRNKILGIFDSTENLFIDIGSSTTSVTNIKEKIIKHISFSEVGYYQVSRSFVIDNMLKEHYKYRKKNSKNEEQIKNNLSHLNISCLQSFDQIKCIKKYLYEIISIKNDDTWKASFANENLLVDYFLRQTNELVLFVNPNRKSYLSDMYKSISRFNKIENKKSNDGFSVLFILDNYIHLCLIELANLIYPILNNNQIKKSYLCGLVLNNEKEGNTYGVDWKDSPLDYTFFTENIYGRMEQIFYGSPKNNFECICFDKIKSFPLYNPYVYSYKSKAKYMSVGNQNKYLTNKKENPNMNIVKVYISYSDKNYFARIKELPGYIITGDTIEEITREIEVSIRKYIKINKELGNKVSEIFDKNFEMKYEYTIVAFLNKYSNIFTKTALAQITGINERQLWYYAAGVHKPRKKQVDKISKGIKKLAEELYTLDIDNDNSELYQ